MTPQHLDVCLRNIYQETIVRNSGCLYSSEINITITKQISKKAPGFKLKTCCGIMEEQSQVVSGWDPVCVYKHGTVILDLCSLMEKTMTLMPRF